MSESDTDKPDIEERLRQWLQSEAALADHGPQMLYRRVHAIPASGPVQRLRWPRIASFAGLLAVGTVAAAALVVIAVVRLSTPSGSTSTLHELELAVTSSVESLARSAAVEGLQESYIDGHLGSAVWFDWRPNGEAVVIQSVDTDVTDSGWWVDPGQGPTDVGSGVVTTIWVLTGETFSEATLVDGDPKGVWTARGLEEAPPGPLALGVALLEEDAPFGLAGIEDGEVSRSANSEGDNTWTLITPHLDGSMIQRWRIAASGDLQSWSFRLVNVDVEDRIYNPITSGQITFTSTLEPAAIPTPDPGAKPHVNDFDLPSDFPLPVR